MTLRPYVPRSLSDHLRRLIDARVRELAEVPEDCPIGKGSERGYKMGCRCALCREASRQRKARWREEHIEYSRQYDRDRRRKRADASA